MKPNKNQRIELWKKLIPVNLPLEENFDLEELAKYELNLVVKLSLLLKKYSL